MKKLELRTSNSNYSVISLAKGGIFFVKYMRPDITGLAEEDLTNPEKLRITQDIILVVEGLHKSGQGCKHIRFIRSERKYGQGLNFVQVKPWPKLRRALQISGEPRTEALGGFEKALIYRDEIAVPNFSVSGSSGWIIPKNMIGVYMLLLPPLPEDSGKLLRLFVEDGGHGSPDTYGVEIYTGDGYPKNPVSWYDRSAGVRRFSDPRHLYEVRFDQESAKVKEIIHVPTEKPVDKVCISYTPGIQTSTEARVGKRLPEWARKYGRAVELAVTIEQ